MNARRLLVAAAATAALTSACSKKAEPKFEEPAKNAPAAKEEPAQAVAEGATELHITGGLNTKLPFSYFTDLLSSLKREYPQLHLKAFTMVEFDYETIEHRLRELAFLNSGVHIVLTDARPSLTWARTASPVGITLNIPTVASAWP